MDSRRCSQVRQPGQSSTTLHAPPQLIRLHVFEDDTVAKVAVSKANLRVFLFWFLLGPPPFFVASLSCFVAKRKSGWGICGSFLVVVLVVWFVSRDYFAGDFWTTRVLYTTAFHCLRNCKDRA